MTCSILEQGAYVDMIQAIPHAKNNEVSRWINEWNLYKSKEAYDHLVEQHIRKAIIIASKLALKYKRDIKLLIQPIVDI